MTDNTCDIQYKCDTSYLILLSILLIVYLQKLTNI